MKIILYSLAALLLSFSTLTAQDEIYKSGSWTNIGAYIYEIGVLSKSIPNGGSHVSYNRSIG